MTTDTMLVLVAFMAALTALINALYRRWRIWREVRRLEATFSEMFSEEA